MLWEHEPLGKCSHSFFEPLTSVFLSSYRNTILNQSASAHFLWAILKCLHLIACWWLKSPSIGNVSTTITYVNNDGKTGFRNDEKKG